MHPYKLPSAAPEIPNWKSASESDKIPCNSIKLQAMLWPVHSQRHFIFAKCKHSTKPLMRLYCMHYKFLAVTFLGCMHVSPSAVLCLYFISSLAVHNKHLKLLRNLKKKKETLVWFEPVIFSYSLFQHASVQLIYIVSNLLVIHWKTVVIAFTKNAWKSKYRLQKLVW